MRIGVAHQSDFPPLEDPCAELCYACSDMSMPFLVYMLPVHNEAVSLRANVDRLATYLTRFGSAEIFLIENGSTDDSWDIAQNACRTSPIAVRAYRESGVGIGYAYDRGLREALSRFGPSKHHWAVLTAADLPFGTSDVEAALVHLDPARTRSRILMGSKAHDDSQVTTSAQRKLMTFVYRVARRSILGMRVGDSQGSLFLRLDLASELVPVIESRNFFYSTELCHFAERLGEDIIELPIAVEVAARPSTVRPLEHGSQMAMQLWRLRRRAR